MDVVFLTHSYPRHPGDAPGSFLLRLARALADEGVGVSVVAPGAPGLAASDVLEGISVRRYRYAPRRLENLAYHGQMAELVRGSWPARLALLGFLGAGLRAGLAERRERGAAIVHAHWWFPGGLVGSWVSRLSGTPLVTTMHGTDVRLARDVPAARRLFRGVMRASSAVTTVSRFLAEQAGTVDPDTRALVAPMPVATELFSPPSDDGDRSRDGLLFVGRLTPQKGVDRLLQALAAMRRSTSLTIVGDGPERDRLGALASQIGVAERVTWVPAVRQTELPPFYRRAAALVVPSHEEGLGLVAVEAMLSGAPVVAFDSGGLREVVEHDRTGILVPAGDAAALAAALDDLLGPGGGGRRRDLARAGRERALATFSPTAVARRYAHVYRQVTEASGHRRGGGAA